MSMQATVSPAVMSPPSLWAYVTTIIRGVGGNGKEFCTERDYNLESNATRVCSIAPWPMLWMTASKASPCPPRGQGQCCLVTEAVSGKYAFMCFGTYVQHCMRHGQCRWGAAMEPVHHPHAVECLGTSHVERMKLSSRALCDGGDGGSRLKPFGGTV